MSAETENDFPQDIYLKAAHVRLRYGNCSDMWITRRQKDAGFPDPIYFGSLRYWKLSDRARWEGDQKAAPKSRAARDMKRARVA